MAIVSKVQETTRETLQKLTWIALVLRLQFWHRCEDVQHNFPSVFQILTSFRFITIYCGIDSIPRKFPHISIWMWGIFHGILSILHNNVMHLKNVMLIAMMSTTLFIHRKVTKNMEIVALVPSLRISNFRGLENWFTQKNNYPNAFQM